MSKVLLLLVICCLSLLQIKAQSQADRDFCRKLNQKCLRHEAATGKRDDATNFYNDYCRRTVGTSWKNITRCQLIRASCEFTLVRCANLYCKNVEEVLRRSV